MLRTCLTLELSTFHAGVPNTIVAGLTSVLVAFENMAVGASGIDGFVSAELTLAVDADALARGT